MKRVLLLVAVLGLLVLTVGSWFLQPLPEPDVPVSSKFLDSQGRLIASIFQENRVEVPLAQVNPYMQKAIIAVEDARFYRHFGIDPVGLVRAVYTNIQARRVVEGGSTITQQLAKNLYLTQERTVLRKIREVILALRLERTYTKDEILEKYLNQIYFGHGAYGVEVAAQTFFGTSAEKLSLAQSALLAGLPRGPATYSPYKHPDRAKKRQLTVLGRMLEVGAIDKEDYEQAKKAPLNLMPLQRKNKAPFFTEEVINYLAQELEGGEERIYRGGITVYTTLDLKMQEAAERAFAEGLAPYDRELEGALVAIDPQNGYVKALVGGRNYQVSRFNRATKGKRQPGSAMKPFLYTAALDLGYTQATMIRCEPVFFPQPGGDVYSPTDYEQDYHYRDFTLKEAVKISDNVVAVKLNHQVGPAIMAEYAQKMGISSPLRKYLSLALGTSEVTPLEITAAYTPLANQGIRVTPLMVLKVTDNRGRVILENKPERNVILNARVAYLVTDMLKSALEPGGTAGQLGGFLGRPAAGKTGTTQEFRDAWFIGYTPELVAGVYVGFDDYSRPVGMAGGIIAGPIWARFIKEALQGAPPKDFPRPEGITQIQVCLTSGLVATEYCPSVMLMSFINGTEPKEKCTVHTGAESSKIEQEEMEDPWQDLWNYLNQRFNLLRKWGRE